MTSVAESRYNDILSANDASEIEYEAVDTLDVKPTKGAMRVMDLLETFTGANPTKFKLNKRSISRFGGI